MFEIIQMAHPGNISAAYPIVWKQVPKLRESLVMKAWRWNLVADSLELVCSERGCQEKTSSAELSYVTSPDFSLASKEPVALRRMAPCIESPCLFATISLMKIGCEDITCIDDNRVIDRPVKEYTKLLADLLIVSSMLVLRCEAGDALIKSRPVIVEEDEISSCCS